MVEVGFVVVVDEGAGNPTSYADLSVEGEEVPIFFKTYEEAHANLHKLRHNGVDYGYGLLIDVVILAGSGECDIRFAESKCTFEQEATK